MPNNHKIRQALDAEFERLGLRLQDLPGAGLATDSHAATEQLLVRLRVMVPGVTWRDVFPDLPAHWQPGRPETWTTPYRPFGPYDYQELPTGPAVHAVWDHDASVEQLEHLIAAATRSGWPVYGAGFIGQSTLHAMIVLERGTVADQTYSFAEWLNQQAGVRLAAIPRTGRESYVP